MSARELRKGVDFKVIYYLAIGIGGSLGACCRYLLGKYIYSKYNHPFPLATWIVNISGSYLLGIFVAINQKMLFNPTLESLIILGFLSSYTTFSTFSYELLQLLQRKSYGQTALYAISSLLLGMAAAYIGLISY